MSREPVDKSRAGVATSSGDLARKPYESPRLTAYGSIEQLTAAKIAGSVDSAMS